MYFVYVYKHAENTSAIFAIINKEDVFVFYETC